MLFLVYEPANERVAQRRVLPPPPAKRATKRITRNDCGDCSQTVAFVDTVPNALGLYKVIVGRIIIVCDAQPGVVIGTTYASLLGYLII
jgi:hypothetical protein